VIRRVDSNAGLFIKGFGKEWTHKDIFDHFKRFGEIISAKVSIDETHHSRGYGFVQFTKEEEAKEALSQMDGMELE
jgi:polyadenylate-binding protein